MSALPGSLGLTSAFPFVGRASELRTLRALVPRAEGEGRRVVLVGGEPGSGKSRLGRGLASHAAADGAPLLYGACDPGGRAPYGPLGEAPDPLARTVEPDELRDALGPTGGELARLLPDLPARVGGLPDPVAADPDTERHRLHTAVADLLTGISRGRPLLLVLEDGHWADTPTLLLMRFLTRAAGRARLLLLATFRDAEVDVPPTLVEALADLRRSDDVVRVRLSALAPDEITEFVRRAGGGEAPPELAQTIGALTDGNAFLVCELWRALVETGAVELADGTLRLTRSLADLGTPESVREVVSERLARLARGTTELLELAATAGGEFELDIVRRAGGVDDAELLARLDEAVRSGILEELRTRALTYRFAHELVRRALYDRPSGVRRPQLHLPPPRAPQRPGPAGGPR